MELMHKTWPFFLVALVITLMGSGVGLVLTGGWGDSQVGSEEMMSSIAVDQNQVSDAGLTAPSDLSKSGLNVGGGNVYQIECNAECRKALLGD
jgi:hypothetical protein